MYWKPIQVWLPLPTFRTVARVGTISVLLLFSMMVAAMAVSSPTPSASYVLPLEAPNRMIAGTYMALLKSQPIIEDALRDRDVHSMMELHHGSGASSWLRSHLEVTLCGKNHADSVKLTLTSSLHSPHELQIIVDAVAKSYRKYMDATSVRPAD